MVSEILWDCLFYVMDMFDKMVCGFDMKFVFVVVGGVVVNGEIWVKFIEFCVVNGFMFVVLFMFLCIDNVVMIVWVGVEWYWVGFIDDLLMVFCVCWFLDFIRFGFC